METEKREFGSLRQRGKAGTWYARYRVGGKEHWESLKTTNKAKAEKRLAVIEDRVERGEHTPGRARRLAFADLERMLREHYQNKGLRSLWRADYAMTKHLRPAFGDMRALAITTEKVAGYEAARLASGAARATVNYELSLLRKMFKLAGRRLPSRPEISIPDPHNARKGYFEPDDFAAVLAELPDHLKPVFQFAYMTGWRVKSEVLPVTWDRVDFRAGVVRLDTSKNSEGRTFPFAALPELAGMLNEQRERTTALERATGRIIANVFHRSGNPLKSYRHGWASACDRAAKGGKRGALASIVRPQLVGRIAHDFRRTAVRNLVRAGVPESIAMKLTGHKTRAIFDRYDIVDEADLRDGVSRLAVHLGQGASKQGDKGATGEQTPLQLLKAAQ